MNFDDITDRVGTHSSKWDMMEKNYGVSPDDGIAMWVADMDFRSPECVQRAVRSMLDNGNYGYFGDYRDYHASIGWWMENRHNWPVEPEWIFTTHGLCNAVGLTLAAYTDPGDAVMLFTPVYHAFARVIRAGGRSVTETPLALQNGVYEMDLEAAEAALTGREKAVILCSPHNPGGRVWARDEINALAAFCIRHDLLLISDEIHQDLIFPGATHLPTAIAAPQVLDRLVVLNAPSKTFNIAGTHTGQVIIPDNTLRQKFVAVMNALSVSPSNFGVAMTTAAYSPEGAAWVDELLPYLDGNRKLFDDMINAIPGLSSMPMQATYLAWVDFSATGMGPDEYKRRVLQDARIAVNLGSTFGEGGSGYLRFNLGTQRARVQEACDRLTQAFSDLQ